MSSHVFDEYQDLEKAYKNPRHLMSKKMCLVTKSITGGHAILDFGCGQGELLERVRDLFGRVVGVDITEKALELTRNKLGGSAKATLYKYKGSVPMMEGNFDWVTCLDVLEHLEYPIKVLREIYGLMADNGNLIVTVPNWYDIINSKFLKRSRFHLQTHTPWGWMLMLREAGFKINSFRAVGFPLIDLDFLTKRLYFLGMCIFIHAEKV